MIQFKYRDLNNSMVEGLGMIQGIPFPAKTAYTLHKLHEKVQALVNQARDEHKVLVQKFAYQNEDGSIKSFPAEPAKPATDPNGVELKTPDGEALMTPATKAEPFRLIPEQMEAYRAAVEAFFDTVVELPQYAPISLRDLGEASLTPECIGSIAPLLEKEQEPKPRLAAVPQASETPKA